MQQTKILGLRTVVYMVSDLEAAKSWYAKAFDAEPYYDTPYYVGFNIAGYELGLHPEAATQHPKGDNILTYWGVHDIHAAYRKLIDLGAVEHQAPENVGGEIIVASVKEAWGNVIGLIYNPDFKLP